MKKEKALKVNNNKKVGFWNYLSKYKFCAFLYVFLVLLSGISTIVTTILGANAIECITLLEYKKAIIIFSFGAIVVVLERVFVYISKYIYFKYSGKIMAELNLDLAKQAFKLNSATYNNHDTGMFVQRIVNDPERIVDKLATVIDYLTDLITAVILIIYIITLNPIVALIIIISVLFGVILEVKRRKVYRKNIYTSRTQQDGINSLTTEIVRSEKDIKSLGLENKLSKVANDDYTKYKIIRNKTNIVDVGFWTVRDIIVKVIMVLLLILGVYLKEKSIITLATFMIVYTNTHSVIDLIRNLGRIGNTFTEIKISNDRMFDLFDEKEFVTEKFGDVNLENVVGDIEFKNVAFSFKDYEYERKTIKTKENNKTIKKHIKECNLVNENKLFKNLSFKIEHNTTVAFVGKSGSGKSTILNLIAKMYEVDNGQVLIDGVDVKTLNKNSLRKSISLVNQFPYIFDMTIKENLLLAKEDATDEEIKEAIKKACLDDFIKTLPLGLETNVGESGVRLSGGQKQRLAIARAFLRNSSIIIFDESTSSLDNIAQEEIKNSIDRLKGTSTVVIVAHRLSTIKNVDKIFFLDNGKIVDSGTFEELFNNNEKFKTMFLAENI